MKPRTPFFSKPAIITFCTIFGLFGALICGYGHAALSTDLLISGEAMIEQSGGNFTSEYMQDVTPEECEKVALDATAQLIDKRDGKKYWVTRFRDGGCWMVQDLRFDILPDEDGKIELTSELSDINPSADNWTLYDEEIVNGQTIYKWNANSKYPPVATTNTGSIGTKATTTYSRHPLNERIVATPLTSGKTLVTLTERDANNNLVWLYQPRLNFPNGTSYDKDLMTFDEHYIFGVYYQHMTATAGSHKVGEDAVSSVCPKGWTLPHRYSGEATDPLRSYPITTVSLYKSDGKSTAWPFYFSRAGNYLNNTIDVLGSTSYHWTAAMVSSTNGTVYTATYTAAAGITSAVAVKNGSLYYGSLVRCGLRMD